MKPDSMLYESHLEDARLRRHVDSVSVRLNQQNILDVIQLKGCF